MPFACHTPNGQVVKLDDLPVEDLQRIAAEHGIESWFDLYLQPARQGGAAVALLKHCAATVGETVDDPVTPKALLGAWKQVKDDDPTMWENGAPLEGEATTDSSSPSTD